MKNIEAQIIRAICNNNLSGAKCYTKEFLQQNTLKKDEFFCQQMLSKLNDKSMSFINLPPNISSFLIVEDVSVSFNENRYYLSNREDEIIKLILKMDKVSEKLAEMNINYLNSIMLYGESGTGKTTFGRYIAHKLNVPFAYLNLSMVMDSYLGSTAKNITRVFDYLKQEKCVFMLDEIDSIGSRRGDSHDTAELSRIVIGLMQNIDMLSNNVILLGGTNRIDIIDDALLRRFSIKHEVKRLDVEERKQLAYKFFEDINFKPTTSELSKLIHTDRTQSELINEIIQMVANKLLEGEK